jgi:BlaI family transcriptional regulator, penicillinase repressor
MNIPKPTDSELEILQILWQKGEATVRTVNDEINLSKETGYTTTLKLMQIMHEKDLVTRNAAGKQHIFKANLEEKATQKNLVNRFIDAAFQGNAMNLVMQTLGNHQASADEMAQLKALIVELENKQN